MSRNVLSVVHGPVYGGGHNQMIELRRPLERRGFRTVALVPEEPGTARPRLEAAGVDTVALPLSRLRATFRPAPHARLLRGLPGEVSGIRSLIRERSIDVVQVHGPTNPHAAIAARLEHIPVVWQLYEMRTPMAARRATMPFVLRLADVLMTTGLEVARLHPGALRARDRLVTFVPPVDSGKFRPDPARRAAARDELGIPAGSLAFGTLGNLNPDKGHEFLLRAARDVIARRPTATLRILGSKSPVHASYEAGLRREAGHLGDSVRFVDPGDRAAELLPGLDLFVLASRREGIPTVVLEAMACGLPVVTTDVGAVREIASHGANAIVVPPCDPRSLATALLELLDDEDRREAFGAAGRLAAVEDFGVERCADAHEAAYRMALGVPRLHGPPLPVEAVR